MSAAEIEQEIESATRLNVILWSGLTSCSAMFEAVLVLPIPLQDFALTQTYYL